jgi:benzylsuccinate CoA-transferase BbsF subunit
MQKPVVKNTQALKGLKVLDFTWVITGPIATKFLGDYGAEVIKVESPVRYDAQRSSSPYVGGIPGVNRSGIFSLFNTSKASLSLNLNTESGIEIARKLVGWADILIESFTAGTMEKWHLGFEDLKSINPKIIMVRTSLRGQKGPYAKTVGLGIQTQGIAGISYLTGWSDKPPIGPRIAYTDYVAPWYVLLSIMAALEYRRQTGRGQMIDVSQVEAGVSFLAPAILDYTCNSRVETRQGNKSDYAAPHAAYPCKGDDRWCVISVFTDNEWLAFCSVLDNSALMSPKYATLAGRKANEVELDEIVSAWTSRRSPKEVMDVMQQNGIAAGVVQNAEDIFNNPQVKHREYIGVVDHPEMGPHMTQGQAFKLSVTPSKIGPPPVLGADNERICTEILGMSTEEFIKSMEAGAFS